MAVYNGEKFLNEAIDSILAQSFADFEFIIINDGSTDATEDIILSYSDSRIRYVKNEQNLRLIATLNKGLALCQGTYVARMDADDIAMPSRLQEQVDFMERNPRVGLCGAWIESFGVGQPKSVGFKKTHSEVFLEFLLANHFNHPTAFMRRDVLTTHGLHYPAVLHAEDYAMWMSIVSVSEVHILPRVLLRYRLHESSVCATNKPFQDEQSAVIRRQFFTQWGIDCGGKDYKEFERWILVGDAKLLSSRLIVRFLATLRKYMLLKSNIDNATARQFFVKHVWRVMCESPSTGAFVVAFWAGMLERGVKHRLVLLARSVRNSIVSFFRKK
jgi:glycosyltransferase involved in cell wall biosynthesis